MRHRRPRGPLLERACHEQIKYLSNEYQVTAEHNGRSEWNAASLVSGSAYFLLQIRYREGPGHEHFTAAKTALPNVPYRCSCDNSEILQSQHTYVCCSQYVRCWLQATKTRKLLLLASKNLIIHTSSMINGENTISPLEQVNTSPSDYSLNK